MITPPRLYAFKNQLKYSIYIFLAFLMLRLLISYNSYQEFISKPFYFIDATVIDSYTKHKDSYSYTVLKLRSDDGLRFFTTTHSQRDFKDTKVRLQIFPNDSISFGEYMSSFYVKSKLKSTKALSPTLKQKISQYISNQHTSSSIASFFSAIFLATPLDKTIREQISKLGVSHLVALSGLHLGLLWAFMYAVLLYPYRFLQQRFFAYRYDMFDLGFIALIFLGYYVYMVGYPPSLLRAYGMLFFGWGVLVMGLELVSFEFLLTVVMVLLLVLPSLLFSIGFWLSVIGVFYIFLILGYTKEYDKKIVAFVMLPIGIYLLMQPIAHAIFGTTTFYQLASPLLSILFTPFYIISIFLHLIGVGGVFDNLLSKLLSLKITSVDITIPKWFIVPYLILSYKAIKNKMAFYILLIIVLLYSGLISLR
jgi:competence protein ComEC